MLEWLYIYQKKKKDFKTKHTTEEEHFAKIKGSIHQEALTIINTNMQPNIASKYMKQKMTEKEREIRQCNNR